MTSVRFFVDTPIISLTEDFSLEELQITNELSPAEQEEAVRAAFQKWFQREVQASWTYLKNASGSLG